MFLKDLSFFNVSILSWTRCNKAFALDSLELLLWRLMMTCKWLNPLPTCFKLLISSVPYKRLLSIFTWFYTHSHSQGKLIEPHSFKYYGHLYDSQIYISFAQISPWHTPLVYPTAYSTSPFGCLIGVLNWSPDIPQMGSAHILLLFNKLLGSTPSFQLHSPQILEWS